MGITLIYNPCWFLIHLVKASAPVLILICGQLLNHGCLSWDMFMVCLSTFKWKVSSKSA